MIALGITIVGRRQVIEQPRDLKQVRAQIVLPISARFRSLSGSNRVIAAPRPEAEPTAKILRAGALQTRKTRKSRLSLSIFPTNCLSGKRWLETLAETYKVIDFIEHFISFRETVHNVERDPSEVQ